LKPEERKEAREKYNELKQLPPEKRIEVKEKWREHDAKKRAEKDPAGTATPAPAPPPQ
jgi:Protein of unknown function (DUF3106)